MDERGYTIEDVRDYMNAPADKLSLMVRDGLALLAQWMTEGEDDE